MSQILYLSMLLITTFVSAQLHPLQRTMCLTFIHASISSNTFTSIAIFGGIGSVHMDLYIFKVLEEFVVQPNLFHEKGTCPKPTLDTPDL